MNKDEIKKEILDLLKENECIEDDNSVFISYYNALEIIDEVVGVCINECTLGDSGYYILITAPYEINGKNVDVCIMENDNLAYISYIDDISIEDVINEAYEIADKKEEFRIVLENVAAK